MNLIAPARSFWQRLPQWISAGILFVVVLVVYYPALAIGFHGNDWEFVGIAATTPFLDYLAYYFNPLTQTYWYRPLLGVLFLANYLLFGSNAPGYHLGHIVLHFFNTILLYDLIRFYTRQQFVALSAAVIFATLPIYDWSVLWPADIVPLQSLFCLLSIRSWNLYLRGEKQSDYILAFLFFVLALLTRESSLTLPAILFLIEWLLLRQLPTARKFVRQFWIFILAILIYFPLVIYIHLRGGFYSTVYEPGFHMAQNFFRYALYLCFPWVLPEPFGIIFQSIGWTIFLGVMIKEHSRGLIFLALAFVLSILFFLPFPQINLRYYYMPAMISAILVALALERMQKLVAAYKPWFIALIVSAVVFGNSIGVAVTAQQMTDLARLSRVDFRTVAQNHPAFPDDAYLYFIGAYAPSVDQNGMFRLRYGSGIHASGNDIPTPANLRSHKNPIVIYINDEGKLVEQSVTFDSTKISQALPIDFEPGIRLEGYELASASLRKNQALVLLLYWKPAQKIHRDYTLFVHLIDAGGKSLDGQDAKRDTSQWKPGRLYVDSVVIPAAEIPAGKNFRLQIGWYDLSMLERAKIQNSSGDYFEIQPIEILE